MNLDREGVTGPEKNLGDLFKGSVDASLIIGASAYGNEPGLTTFLGDVTTDYIANDSRIADKVGNQLTFRKTLTVSREIYNNGIIRVEEGDDTPHTAKLILKEGAHFVNGYRKDDVTNLGVSNDALKEGVQVHIDQLEVEAGATIDNNSTFEVKNLIPKGEGVTYNQRNAGSLTVESGEWFKNSTINLEAGELDLNNVGGMGEGNTYTVADGVTLKADNLGTDNKVTMNGQLDTLTTSVFGTKDDRLQTIDTNAQKFVAEADRAAPETEHFFFGYTGDVSAELLKETDGTKNWNFDNLKKITLKGAVSEELKATLIKAFDEAFGAGKGEAVLAFDETGTPKDKDILNVAKVNELAGLGIPKLKDAVYVTMALEGEGKDVVLGNGDGELVTSGFTSIKDASSIVIKDGKQLTLVGSTEENTQLVGDDVKISLEGEKSVLALGSKGLGEDSSNPYQGVLKDINATDTAEVHVDAGKYTASGNVTLNSASKLNVDEIATFNVSRLDAASPDTEITNAGTLNVQLSAVSGGKLTNTGTMTVDGSTYFMGTVDNSGEFLGKETVEVSGTLANSGTFKADGDTTLSGQATNTGTWTGQKTTLEEGGVLTHKSGQLNIADLAFVGNGTLKLEDKNFKIDNVTWDKGNFVIGNDSGDVISYTVTSTDPINTVLHAKNNGDLAFGENAFSVADSLGAPKVGTGTASRVVLTSQVKTAETGGVVVGTTDTANGLGSLYFAKDSTTLIDVATVGNKGDVSAFTRSAEGGKVTVENGATLILGNIKDPGKYTITEGYLTNDVVGGWNDAAHLYALSAEDTGLGWKLVLQHDANTIWIDATPEEATSIYKDLIVPKIADDSLLNCNSGNAGANFICKVLKDPKLDVAGKTRVINSVAQIAFAGGAMATSANDMSTAIDSLEGRLSFKDEVFTPEGYLRDIGFGSNLWIDMIGGKQSYKSLSATGYSKEGFKTDSYGFIAGYDQKLSNKPILLGGAFSVLRGDLKSRSGELLPTTSQYDSYGIHAYGLWTPSPALNLVGNLSYMHNSADIDQTLEGSYFSKAEANVGTRLFAASLRAETHLKYGDFIVIPHIGARYIHAKMSDFATKVDGQTIWNTSSEGVNAFQTPVGVALRSDFQTASGWVVRPHADLAFIPTFGDRDYSSTVKNGNAVTDGLSAEYLSKYATSLKVGVQGDYGPSTVGLSYRVIRSEHGGLDQALKLELRRAF